MAAFTDDFTGTSDATLESRTGWTRVDGVAGAAKINAANQLKTASATDTAYQAQSAGSADHYAQGRQLVNAVSAFPICVRVVNKDNFIGYRFNDTANKHELYKRVASTFTLLGSFNAAFSATDVIKVEIVGTSVQVYINTVSRIGPFTVSDAVFSGVQTPGLICRSALYNPFLDDWESDAVAAAAATAYTLTGPSSGTVGVASSNFTVTPDAAVSADVVVTPSDGGDGGTFSPTSVTFASGTSTPQTFTYTPASSGAKTISTTNDGSLTDPSSLSFTASAASSFQAAWARNSTITISSGARGA